MAPIETFGPDVRIAEGRNRRVTILASPWNIRIEDRLEEAGGSFGGTYELCPSKLA